MKLLGDTPKDRRMALGLLGMFVLLSPIIFLAEVSRVLGVPCKDP